MLKYIPSLCRMLSLLSGLIVEGLFIHFCVNEKAGGRERCVCGLLFVCIRVQIVESEKF